VKQSGGVAADHRCAAVPAPGYGLVSLRDGFGREERSKPIRASATIVSLMIVAAMYGPQAAFFSELFGTDVRYTGASIGYQLASPLAGGLAPLISGWLLKWADGQSWPIAVYLILLSAITLISVWLAAETHTSCLGEAGEST
jgi:MFS transporter, MHS family, shikimate and dehydroshikimate transport protein